MIDRNALPCTESNLAPCKKVDEVAKKWYCKVVLNHFYDVFTYSFDPQKHSIVMYGRVSVPVLNRTHVGVVCEISNSNSLGNDVGIRSVNCALDYAAVISEDVGDVLMQCKRYFVTAAFPFIKSAIASYYLNRPFQIFPIADKLYFKRSDKLRIAQVDVFLEHIDFPKKKKFMTSYHLSRLGNDNSDVMRYMLLKEHSAYFHHSAPEKYLGEFIPTKLSAKEQEGVDEISKSLDNHVVNTIWYEDKRRSRRTYFEVIARVLSRGQQVIIVTPTIACCSSLAAEIKYCFNDTEIEVINSSCNSKTYEYAQILNRIRWGQVNIVICTRKGIFFSFFKLGLIVVEDEQSPYHKLGLSKRFVNARDVLLMRAERLNIPIILTTILPSLTTYKNIAENKYSLINISNKQVRPIEIVDTSWIAVDAVGISDQSHSCIRQAIELNEQVVILLNSTGYCKITKCHSCNHIKKCDKCKVNLTLSRRGGAHYLCPKCKRTERLVDTKCSKCEGDIRTIGVGTEQMAMHLSRIYPKRRIYRIDSYTKKVDEKLEAIRQGDGDVIVASNSILRSGKLPHVGLIIIMDIDRQVMAKSWLSIQNTACTIAKVRNLAARRATTLIQSQLGGMDRVLQLLKQGRYTELLNYLLEKCRRNRLSPFTNTSHLLFEANSNEKMKILSHAISAELIGQRCNKIYISKGRPRALPILKGQIRGYIEVKSICKEALQLALHKVITNLRANRIYDRILIDTVPLEEVPE